MGAGVREQTVLPQGPQGKFPHPSGREEGHQLIGVPRSSQLGWREGGTPEECLTISSQNRAVSDKVKKGLICPAAKAAGGAKIGVVFGAKVVKFTVAGDEADQDGKAGAVQLQ